MKNLNGFKKYFALIVTFAMLLTLIPTNVFATTTNSPVIDGTKKGSLTINKYDSNYTEENKKPIKDVEFTIYNIANLNDKLEYSFSENIKPFFDNKELTVDVVQAMEKEQLATLGTELNVYIINNKIEGTTRTTNSEGQAQFENLNLGWYLVSETAYPDQVVTPSAPFFVSIPMTNAEGTGWIYDVVANPKNVTSSTGTGLTLTKYGKEGNNQAVKLPGAEFELQKFNGTQWEKVGNTLTTDENGKIEVDGLTRGVYQFVETKAPEGYILNTKVTYEFKVVWNETTNNLEYVYNNVQDGSLNIEVINEKPTIDKELVGNSSVDIGDVVSWTIKASVPENIKHLETFKIIDKLSSGLTYEGNLKVKGVSTQISEFFLTEGEHYTLTVINDRSVAPESRLVVQLKPEKLEVLKEIEITYETKLNENAVIGSGGNLNEVMLEYSTSTESGSTTKPTEPPVDPKVHTFGLKLTKENKTQEKLSGAVFNLYKADGTTLVKDNLTTDKDGFFKVDGLAAGNYVLVETKAPVGYNLLKEPIKFEIKESYNAAGELVEVNTVNGYYLTTVLNNKGFQLPTTGGMGTMIFTLGGLALMGIAAGAYVVSKRKESK